MADVLTTLTALAVSVFRSRSDEGLFPNSLLANRWFDLPVADPVLREISRMAVIPANQDSAINEFANLALDHPDLAPIALRDGELDPMILTPGGGFRMSPQAIISALFSSAFRQMYFLRLKASLCEQFSRDLKSFDVLQEANAFVLTPSLDLPELPYRRVARYQPVGALSGRRHRSARTTWSSSPCTSPSRPAS